MANEAKEVPKVDLIVERYVALRQRKTEMKKAYDESVAEIDAAMEKIENHLLKRMQDAGVDSMKTEFGTAYTTVKTSATVSEWPALLKWVQDNDEWGVLTQGVSKDAVKAYREANDDLPPGVNWREIRAVNIRKS